MTRTDNNTVTQNLIEDAAAKPDPAETQDAPAVSVPKSRATKLVANEHMRKLFDCAHYAAQIGLSLAPREHFSHYLETGAALGYSPHPDFHAGAYLKFNPDVPRDPLKAFDHYASYGRGERRYASADRMTRDVAIVEWSGMFDRQLYESNCDIDLDGYGSAIIHYLTRGWKAQRRPNANFDSEFYLKYYSDAAASLLPPFLHYLVQLQRRRAPYQNEKEVAPDLLIIEKSGVFDKTFYRDKYKKLIPEGCDAAIHFLTTGQILRLESSPRFSTRFYLRSHPDLRHLERPVLHYATHGHKENRSSVFSQQATVVPGGMLGDSAKPNLLLTLHEASRTGAPILGYNLIHHLSRQFNIIIWLMKPGVLEPDLASRALALVKAPPSPNDVPDALKAIVNRFRIDVAILNSAVCQSLSDTLYELKVPIVSLLHEFRDYILPRGVLAKLAMFSDSVICPSSLVSDSLQEECVDYLGWVPRHFEIRHQGHCLLPPLAKTASGRNTRGLPLKVKAALARKPGRPVVLGAGWVHMRKGVELFVQIAQMYRDAIDPDVLFVWVGGGFNPTAELGYTVWLQSHINVAGLMDNVIFVDEVRSLQPFYDAADVFLMSSRLDPFPNVAIDANMAGLPVLAFERATGFTDVFEENPELGKAIPYLDLNRAVSAISETVTARRADPAMKGRIQQKAQAAFDFGGYAEFVAGISRAAIANAEKVAKGSEALAASGAFDEDFFKSGLINGYLNQVFDLQPAYICLDLARKGIFPVKPRAGLNLASKCAEADFESILATLSGKGDCYSHPVHQLRIPAAGSVEEAGLAGRIAAHVHAYEINGVTDIIVRLAASPVPIEIFVTSDEDEKFEAMKESLVGLDDQIRWITTPNRGRDIGPFLLGLPDEFWNHEIVGHFHVKVSTHLDRQLTEQWKTFVYEHLIGSTEVMQQLFALFRKDPALGLLFAEDPCQIGWTKNERDASALALRLGIPDRLPLAPEFPIGDMFWARSAALAPLLKLGLTWDDMPDEPLPSDGTLLHAIERLTPSVCRLAGFNWMTVRHPSALRYSRARSDNS